MSVRVRTIVLSGELAQLVAAVDRYMAAKLEHDDEEDQARRHMPTVT